MIGIRCTGIIEARLGIPSLYFSFRSGTFIEIKYPNDIPLTITAI